MRFRVAFLENALESAVVRRAAPACDGFPDRPDAGALLPLHVLAACVARSELSLGIRRSWVANPPCRRQLDARRDVPVLALLRCSQRLPIRDADQRRLAWGASRTLTVARTSGISPRAAARLRP